MQIAKKHLKRCSHHQSLDKQKQKQNDLSLCTHQGFPVASDGKESVGSEGDAGSIPGLERSPGEENSYPLQYSCLEISWTEEPGVLQSMGLQRVGALVVPLCDDRHLSTPQILITRSSIANKNGILGEATSCDCSCKKPSVYTVTAISLTQFGRLL